MTGSGLGGGVIFVVAALLWAVVLVPLWVRRREFRAAERHALRLQRTVRLLAQTAEMPEEVRAEATARQALAHEKLARTAQKRQEAEREAELAAARAEQRRAEAAARGMQRKEASIGRSERMRRPAVRRLRGLVAVVTLLGLIGLLVGAGVILSGGGALILGVSALAVLTGSSVLVAIAPGAAASKPVVAAGEAAVEVETVPEMHDEGVDEARVAAEAAAHAAAQQAAAERIARARALARARAQRPAPRVNQPDSMLLSEKRGAADPQPAGQARSAEHDSRKPASTSAESADARIARTPAPPSPAETAERARRLSAAARLRSMGVIEDASAGAPDLDEVLRRRRNVG